MTQIEKKLKRLLDFLDMIPVDQDQDHSFKLEALNGGKILHHGAIASELFELGVVTLSAGIETRWVIQNKATVFVICEGNLDLHYRVNNNNHVKNLQQSQSIRIHAGLPFSLKTYDEKCSVALIFPEAKK